MNYTYTIIDVQTDEIVAEGQTVVGLKMFANDLFWLDEDIDFDESSFEDIKSAIEACDYNLEIESL
jgi:hypothetical protein